MPRTDLFTRVIKTVAAADGVEPIEVDPLHDYIDPEILDKLDEMERKGDWTFEFVFGDYHITVTNDSQLFINGEQYQSKKSIESDADE